MESSPQMTAAVAGAATGGVKTLPREHYLNNEYGLKSWLLTVDHKRIGLLYLIVITAMFFIGGMYAVMIRVELLTPHADLVSPDAYNRIFTLHGIVMVFFFLIPSIPATLGNFLIPMMIGAKDMAFPRLNLLSWYIYLIGATLTIATIMVGGVDTGWTFYPPYSTSYSNSAVLLAGVGVFITGFSSILTGLNFLVTIHKMRAPGLRWNRLPLFVWSNYATALIMVLGTPVVAIAIALVAIERIFGVGIFDPALGGDPILYQHLFWFYSHPAVYIMILPGFGVISELIAAFSRRRIFGYSFVAFSSLAIAVIGFLVWGHHMFVSGQSAYAGMVFSVLSFLVAIPSAVKVFNWTSTLYKGTISYEAPLLYRARFHGALRDRWADGTVPCVDGNRRPCDRHLLRGGALPLYHGGGCGDGVHGRAPFLVAEDDRADVSGGMGKACGTVDLRGLQPHLLPAVHSWISRNAAAICSISAGVSGSAHLLDRRRIGACSGVSAPPDLLHLVAALWRDCRSEPLGCNGAGVADDVAPAGVQLRGDADRDRGGVRVRRRGIRAGI